MRRHLVVALVLMLTFLGGRAATASPVLLPLGSATTTYSYQLYAGTNQGPLNEMADFPFGVSVAEERSYFHALYFGATSVPDAGSSLFLFGIGLAGLGPWRKRRH